MEAEYERFATLAGAEDVVGKVVGWEIRFCDSCWKRERREGFCHSE
jgi:hypothetical protein